MELYVHIPFCRSKCLYCDFASWAGKESWMPAYVDAVLSEANARRTDERIQTVFIGGGTPSVLPESLLRKLLKGLRDRYDFSDHLEFTVESNPGTLTTEWLDTAVEFGVNRISTGAQAVQPEHLIRLGRIHSWEQLRQSAQLVHEAGIKNLNIDLMFGLPFQTVDEWRESLRLVMSLHPQHISCYGLIPEEGTIMNQRLESGEWILPDEDLEREMYDEAIRLLGENGYLQYEISNFALPGYECRHNIGYWQQEPYLGLGTSGASMQIKSSHPFSCLRETNPGTIQDYIRMVDDRQWDKRETELISDGDACFEYMMLGLRMNRGIREDLFAERFGVTVDALYGDRLRRMEKQQLLSHENGTWRLTRRGMDIQNTILVELMD